MREWPPKPPSLVASFAWLPPTPVHSQHPDADIFLRSKGPRLCGSPQGWDGPGAGSNPKALHVKPQMAVGQKSVPKMAPWQMEPKTKTGVTLALIFWATPKWLWLSKPIGSHFGVGEFTQFRTDFSGYADVFRGYGLLIHGQVDPSDATGGQSLLWWIQLPLGFVLGIGSLPPGFCSAEPVAGNTLSSIVLDGFAVAELQVRCLKPALPKKVSSNSAAIPGYSTRGEQFSQSGLGLTGCFNTIHRDLNTMVVTCCPSNRMSTRQWQRFLCFAMLHLWPSKEGVP